MNIDEFWLLVDRSRQKKTLSAEDRERISTEVPEMIGPMFRGQQNWPDSIRHPAGFTITGASVSTFLQAGALLAGKRALGARYSGHPFYEGVENKLAFGIMRSHFHNEYPKGVYCCVRCTLAVHPVLASRAIRYFDGPTLAANVTHLIESGGWRFNKPVNEKLLAWSRGERLAT